jgi:dTDP-glucose 4,6-dehydratase
MNADILNDDVKSISIALAQPCKKLERRRILLTGGTGFFGKWFLHSFLALRNAHGLDVGLTVLSRDPQRFLRDCPEFSGQDGFDFIAGDIRSFALPTGKTFDFVIHGATAASAKLEQDDPGEMYSVITDGMRHMLEIAQRCGVTRLLFISSGAVYGVQPPGLTHVPETYDGSPVTAYGKGKKISEQLCLEASSNRFECVIARPFAFVGPYLPLDTHFAIGNFIRDALAGQPIVIQGDGRPLRSYLYAADLGVWLWTILLSGKSGAIYNVGSPEAISIASLAHLVSDVSSTHPDVVVKGISDEKTPLPQYVPDVRLAGDALGLHVTMHLKTAIQRTLNFHQAQR